NEMDYLEDVYFGTKTLKDGRELAKLRGLYEYCWALKPPSNPSLHVPYNLLTSLAKMAPKGREEEFIVEKLQSYGYLQKDQTLDEGLKKRVGYAFNWIRDFEEIKETEISLSDEEKETMIELIEILKVENEAERIQNAIFNTAKSHGVQPGAFFKTIYAILIGVPQGPRLGPYILAMGKQNVIDALERALKTLL
ncbi:MAG: lysine--tRNA ligase, partial [Candidatus Bathyarchaeota archaeon]|nr:lysine--tRNA ligase [Candidatus Bathyarchaeota archaeon]